MHYETWAIYERGNYGRLLFSNLNYTRTPNVVYGLSRFFQRM